jgi:uncharacterized protein YhaN
MRINRLDLIRYGRFTEAALDFGPPPGRDAPDLHIVYGPNEAGKTTIFNAVLDLFFGMEQRSRYGFRHGYEQMLVGASLEIDGRERTYRRAKLRQNSLMDAAGAPVGEAALAGPLGGISREACRVMFSLDDETLEKGGDSILASKGELGQLLFTASAGLTAAGRELERLEDELAQFHRPNARASGLAEARRKLADLADRRRQVDMKAGDHARLAEARGRAEAAYAEAQARLAAVAARQSGIKAMLRASPLLREHAAIVPDAPALAAEQRVRALAAVLPVYLEQRKDLPNRQAESAASEAEVEGLLRDIGRASEAEPLRLLPRAADAAALKELAGTEAALVARLEAARRAAEEAARALEEAGSAGAPDAAAGALRQLSAALSDVRAERGSGRLRDAERRAAEAEDHLGRALRALAPWTGEPDDLARLAIPAASDVAAAGVRLSAAVKAADEAEATAAKAAADLMRRRAELAALGEFQALAVGAEHPAVRAERDRLWAEHRQRLDAASADAFEAALRRDDAAMLAQLTQASAVARLAEARTSEAVAAAEAAAAADRASRALAAREAAREAVAALVRGVSSELPPSMSAEALGEWLARREAALDAAKARESAARAHREARSDLLALRAALAGALAGAGARCDEALPLSAMEERADERLRQADAAKEREEAREGLVRALRMRREELEQAGAALESWRSAWAAAVARTWLTELSPAPRPAAVLAILDRLVDLRNALDRRAERLDRLGKIERNMEVFAAEVAAMAETLGMSDPQADPAQLFAAVLRRVEAAREADDRLARIADDLALLARENPGTSFAPIDDSALAVELEGLDGEVAALRQGERQAFHERETAAAALAAVGGDAQAALIESERATLLEDLRDGASRWLRLTLGVRAVREAIRLYRDAHRNSMLEAASEAFRMISRDAYRGLSAQSVDGVEQLIAIAADGASKPVGELALSKGTRFQLYLALRVAGHSEFARERPPPPFILDDIMETFDDFRAEEAFRLLARMALNGQVIYLTHHRHLLPIAREACPGVRIHEVPQ